MTGPSSAADVVARLLREDLRGQTAYGAPQLDVPVRLNTNENSYAVPPDVVAAITAAVGECASSLNRYPDREFTDLRVELASWLTDQTGVAIDAAQVWAGNGSNEVLQHVVQAFAGPGRVAMGFTPAYSMHPIISRTMGSTWIDGLRGAPSGVFDLTADAVVAQVREHAPHVVFLCSPNNPTGTALDLEVVAALLAAAPDTLVVVDEAYAEFARPGTPSALSLLGEHPTLVVTRTMSKAFALAGARLGYLAADPAIRDALRVIRLPYHLSAVTQAVAEAALRHADELLAQVDALRVERDACVTWLREQGYTAADSDANFVLFGRFADRHTVWQHVLDRGVLIRETGPDGWLRVSVGTPEEMRAFREALTDTVTSLGIRPADQHREEGSSR